MEKQQLVQANQTRKQGGLNPFITILLLLLTGICVYVFLFGADGNFKPLTESQIKEGLKPSDGDPANFMGIIHKGGVIVPILISMLLMVVVFSIERFFIIAKAEGKGSLTNFVNDIRKLLDKNEINEAISLCDKQKGSIGNVVKEGLTSYKALANDTTLNKEQKLSSLSQTVEEATTLEMPTLEKNMTILATIASVGTLIALMGTVIGMIKAFFALGNAESGAPDAAALSVGISEALVNTALGIGTSALAIIAYNFFTSKIDTLTFKIDEVGLSIQQSFASHH